MKKLRNLKYRKQVKTNKEENKEASKEANKEINIKMNRNQGFQVWWNT